MDHKIHVKCHGNNVVDGINATDKHYLKDKMEPIGKLGSINTSKIGIILSVSKDVSVKITDQWLHVINNKEYLNGLKFITKTKKK